jgi:hypothetical protein
LGSRAAVVARLMARPVSLSSGNPLVRPGSYPWCQELTFTGPPRTAAVDPSWAFSFAFATALPTPQPTFALIADHLSMLWVNKSHSRSASLDIDNRNSSPLVGATTAPTTTIPGDRAAISELPLAEAFL